MPRKKSAPTYARETLPPRTLKKKPLYLWRSRLPRRLRVVFLMLGVAMTAALLDVFHVPLFSTIRLWVFDGVTTGIQESMRGIESLRHGSARVRSFIAYEDALSQAQSENRHLKLMLEEKMLRLEQMQRLLPEGDQVLGEEASKALRVPVLTYPGKPYVYNVQLGAGTRSGVGKNSIMRVGVGLVGRVLSVGETSAHGLLITDMNSRVPITVKGRRMQGVLVGNNTDFPMLKYIDQDKISAGDVIETSGVGGIFPAGIPVGTVFATATGEWRVQPFAKLLTLAHVFIVQVPPLPQEA